MQITPGMSYIQYSNARLNWEIGLARDIDHREKQITLINQTPDKIIYSGHQLKINNSPTLEITCVSRDFLDGEANIDDLKKVFFDTYYKALEVKTASGITDGKTPQDKLEILTSVYHVFLHCILGDAILKCHLNGVAAAGRNDIKTAYYDADLYYLSEDAKNALAGFFKEMCANEHFGNAEIPKYPHVGLDDFNERWKSFYGGGNHPGLVTMIDPSIKPPAGFKLLFQESRFSAREFLEGDMIKVSLGQVTALLKDKTAENEVSVYISVPKGQKLLKLGDLVEENAFMSKIENDIYTRKRNDITDDRLSRFKKIIPKPNENNPDVLIFMQNGAKSALEVYYEQCNNFDAGLVKISVGGVTVEIDVPFRAARAPGERETDRISLASIYSVSEKDFADAAEINAFAKNFILNAPITNLNYYKYV